MNKNLPRILGVLLQGAVMGTLLWLALTGVVVAQHGARIFRYQGF